MLDIEKIIVKTSSYNVWWGIFGISDKQGWEDIELFYENGERVGGLCLNTKDYLESHLEDLRKDPYEKSFVAALENYLNDNKCHYYYYYDKKGSEDFYEVPYQAPKNHERVKPRFTDIWHPDSSISLSTLKTGVVAFAKKHLEGKDYKVEIKNIPSFEELLKEYKEFDKLFGGENPVEISFSEEIINEISELWKKPKKEVLENLNNSINR